MKIYLIRHAQSVPRDGMQYAEAGTVSLSQFGKMQAKALARKISKLGIERIIASPLVRTRETAEIISKGIIPIEFDGRIVEHAPSRTAVGKAYKEAKKATRRDYNFVPENGESFYQCADRFLEALRDISLLPNQTLAIVSHALIIEAALTKLFSLPVIPQIDEASVTLLHFDKGKFSLKSVNDRTWSVPIILHCLKKRLMR